MSRRTKFSSSLSPVRKRTLRSNSTSSDILPGFDLSGRKKKKLLSDLTNNVNVTPGMYGGSISNSSTSNLVNFEDMEDLEDEDIDIEDSDGLDGLDLDNYVEDTSYESLYPTQFNAEYEFNNKNARPNQYGVAYNTNNLGNQYSLSRFDDILKAKKNRCRYADDPSSTYGSVVAFRATNPDTAFMRAYDQQKWSDNYQIGRAKMKEE
jgi:hypothetical protein